MAIDLPYRPLPHQLPFISYMANGGDFAVLNWHRQSGKDLSFTCGVLIPKALQEPGTYWYTFPDRKSVKRDFWDKTDNEGRPMLGHYIPNEIIKDISETDLTIELINPRSRRAKGSMIWVVPVVSVDPESLRGATLKGIGYSEFAHYNTDIVFSNLQASLRSVHNRGWQVVLTTPRGHNHHWRLFNASKDDPTRFTSTVTIDDTGFFTWDFIQSELARGKEYSWLMQEYFCSFEAYSRGIPFAEELEYLTREGRITSVPWDASQRVHTCWDLGRDGTVIWCFQRYGTGWAFIDCISDTKMSFDYYAQELRRRPYLWGTHLGPWDLGQAQFYAGNTFRYEIAEALGIQFRVQKKTLIPEQEAAAKALLRLCWFDKDKCREGLEALGAYHYKWDEEAGVLGTKAVHDWASHFAGAFMTGAIGLDDIQEFGSDYWPEETTQLNEYDYTFNVFEA